MLSTKIKYIYFLNHWIVSQRKGSIIDSYRRDGSRLDRVNQIVRGREERYIGIYKNISIKEYMEVEIKLRSICWVVCKHNITKAS